VAFTVIMSITLHTRRHTTTDTTDTMDTTAITVITAITVTTAIIIITTTLTEMLLQCLRLAPSPRHTKKPWPCSDSSRGLLRPAVEEDKDKDTETETDTDRDMDMDMDMDMVILAVH